MSPFVCWQRPRVYLLTLGGLLCVGCPGTIDDPARFEVGPAGTGQSSGSPALDAGQRAASWVGADGSASQVEAGREASTPTPWPSVASDAAVWIADAGATDTGVVQTRDAGTDAAAGCNFKALMANKCGNATCHGGTGAATGLDLTSDGLAARVAGRRASDACSAYLLIDPASPERSALYLKVTDHACGVRMPLGASLASEEQQCILSWIEKL
jgi:hypothetical protein